MISPSSSSTSRTSTSASINPSKISSAEFPLNPNNAVASNMNATAPLTPIFPPFLLNAERTSATVRFTLSVNVSTITAAPFGPYPS